MRGLSELEQKLFPFACGREEVMKTAPRILSWSTRGLGCCECGRADEDASSSSYGVETVRAETVGERVFWERW